MGLNDYLTANPWDNNDAHPHPLPSMEQSMTLSPLPSWRLAVVNSDLPPETKLVALVLHVYTTPEEPFVAELVSFAMLARDTGLSTRSVQNHLNILNERGLITKEDPFVDGMEMISIRYVLIPPQAFEPRSSS